MFLRKIKYLIVLTIVVFSNSESNAQCNDELVSICLETTMAEGLTYIKDFRNIFPKAKKNQQPPFSRKSVILKAGTKYNFTICNDKNNNQPAVIQLFDTRSMLGSNVDEMTGEISNSFEFRCSQTKLYYLIISIKGGVKGCCVVIMSS